MTSDTAGSPRSSASSCCRPGSRRQPGRAARRGNPTAGFGDLRAGIQADIFAGLPAHCDRLTWSADRLHDWQRGRLRALLAVAMARSPGYAARLAGVEPERFELADLPNLPVLTKAELMARFDEISCDPRLNRAAAERALAATTTEPRPLPGGYL